MTAADSRVVAIYWHFEDLVASEYDRVHGCQTWDPDTSAWTEAAHANPSKVEPARIHVPKLLQFGRTIGTVVINRFYADWTQQVFRDYRRSATAKPPVEFVQIHRSTPLPVGVRLPADVVTDVSRNPRISDVLVCSGRESFDGLVEFCEESGRRLHAIGNPNGIDSPWNRRSQFKGYDEIVSPRPDTPPPWEPLVVAPFQGDHDRTLHIGALKAAMLAIDNSFSQTTYGFPLKGGFKLFLMHAETLGYVVLDDQGGSNVWARLGLKSWAPGSHP